jgi:hypothetical protein
MGFSRQILPRERLAGEALTAAMAGIGMRFAARPDPESNIEDTLLFAAEAGMLQDDLRVLSVLVTWWGVHSPWVNADRLTRVVAAQEHPRVRAFWSAAAAWMGKDRRFSRMQRLHQGPRVDLLSAGTEFHIDRHGEDPRFEGAVLRLPAGTLRDRPSDVLSPAELCRRHAAYRHRVMMGPGYRADVFAVLEAHPDLSAAEVARRTYASFATAWQVRRDFSLIRQARASMTEVASGG